MTKKIFIIALISLVFVIAGVMPVYAATGPPANGGVIADVACLGQADISAIAPMSTGLIAKSVTMVASPKMLGVNSVNDESAALLDNMRRNAGLIVAMIFALFFVVKTIVFIASASRRYQLIKPLSKTTSRFVVLASL